MLLPVEVLLTFFLVSTLLSLSPGPDNIFVLTQSIVNGARAGIVITLGLCTGLIFHSVAVAFGLATVFQTSPAAFTALTMMGAGYLLYLAWMSLRANDTYLIADKSAAADIAFMRLYRRGIIMNITNPKVAIFFLAFLPQFTIADQGNMAIQLLTLGAVFILAALLVFCAIASASGQLRQLFVSSKTVQKRLNVTAAVVFALLALRLLLV
ncbi:Homoserine/homoserine lactone efflux protein [Sinobacterium norvegicum]|uniref:Homoserine/homoserine lactone efflux protein n=1 Tax=Sinobacterium norvegicum TaxID=1641715 RepID=A0ABN8EQD1_9GAMM|nr:LysE family translocator [Sinobacterium norvegicum]CAH0992471.1 Homoserine/homoserine lactone efflux protein [Sinobacterium norvegicum]